MKLFEPLSIGTMTLRNRMVMPAMGTALPEEDGTVSDRAVAYYTRRAAGGVALVTLEITGVHPLSRIRPRTSLIDRDECIEGLSRLARGVQAHGAAFSVQLWHAGHKADPAVLGEPPVAPSPVPMPGRANVPRELTEAEIEHLIECFAEGARRAQEAGCDAVEVHGAHGYLIAQFLSPLVNKRTDAYGGDLSRRANFALRVVARIRERVGPRFPVLFKLSASEHVPGGTTLEDTKTVARWLQDAGVDALLISSGSLVSVEWTVQPMMFPRGCLVPFAAAVKSEVDLPVGTVGRINNPALAEKILVEGQADFVALGRALLADPDFPRKALEGRSDEIRTCIACRVCMHREKEPIHCAINPETGKELGWTVEKASLPKRVLVVGAGPGGLEAACIAGRRGHQVTLCDRANSLGGMVALGCKPPSKAELGTLVQYYAGELRRSGVEVRLGQPVTAGLVREMSPDVVVAATGSTPVVPSIPGVEQENLVQAWDVLADKVPLGGSAVVIGGGSVGCETAEYLRARGLEVAVIEMLADFAGDMEPVTRQLFLPHLRSMGVRMLSNARATRIAGNQVTCSLSGGREAVVEGETIVLALGARSETTLVEELRKGRVPVIAVGDCVEPRRIRDAIVEGAEVGRQI